MTDLKKRSLLKLAALSALAAAALVGCGKSEAPRARRRARRRRPPRRPAPKAEPLKIAFAYVGPVGDGGWTFAHDNGRKAIEKEFGDKIVTSFVENVPEVGRRRARDARHGGPGQQADLRHHLRLHGADAQGRRRHQGREVRARHRLQDAPRTCAPTTAAPTKARTWPA